ncbi:ABC transporter permease [Qipengyuania sediminis]|uniref:ABC transporter permease n=1 Tax=Qipengyuania sediminis TaxID=1532023 RepID=UPI001059F07A|nr:FtsX-like permease family protein [Qipengyuania sediminis]
MSWPAAWRLARRDLSARFKGLRLLLVCLFLGTMALTAIGSLTAAIERELTTRGAELLGGDVQVSVWQRGLSEEERRALANTGVLSEGVRLQAMARSADNAVPVELKGVDAAYPLFGSLTLEDGRAVRSPAPDEAWLSRDAADRLGARPGSTLAIGTANLRVGGIIAAEPDRLGEGFQLGPTVIVDARLPAAAGLLAPGSMYRTKVRIALTGAQSPENVGRAFLARFPTAGFEIRTRDEASPGADRFVQRMGDFLTLVGLAALIIAGIGIGGGVTSYLDARRGAIATLKILGATSRDIARIYALEIGAAALVGSFAGVIAGVALTPLLALALGGLLPVARGFVVDPAAIALALGYALLVALVFAAPPLMRARKVPAMALMRARVSPLARDPMAAAVVAAGLAAIAALALLSAKDWRLTAGFLAGAAGAFAILAVAGWLLRRGAAGLPRPRNPVARAALANLHRPGSATGTLVTALGFGLAAFVLLAAVQTAIDGTIARRVPARAPDYFVLDVPRDRVAAFREVVRGSDPRAETQLVPMLRGAVTAFGPPGRMIETASLAEIPEGGWALRGERGLTYAAALPEGNTITAGRWWRPDTRALEVSVDDEFAEAVGLKLGDRVTFGILGVERTATVTSLRRIDWQTMGFNFAFILSPPVLADAPHNLAATVDLAQGRNPAPLLQAMVRAFPSSSVIEVGGVMRQARTLLEQVGLATLAAAGVTVLAGIAVLMGAIAAARAQRSYDTVVLRVLGASRAQVLALLVAEYALLAGVLALVALGLGGIAAWLVITWLFEFDWLPDWGTVALTLGAGLGLVLLFAIAASLPLLREKPARALRSL